MGCALATTAALADPHFHVTTWRSSGSIILCSGLVQTAKQGANARVDAPCLEGCPAVASLQYTEAKVLRLHAICKSIDYCNTFFENFR